jgi:hypothetical protein
MSRGALTLATYPFDEVRIRCEPCGREGRYRRTRLIERLGADTSMPDVLGRITADCPRKRAFAPVGCRAIYPHLEVHGSAMGGATHHRLLAHHLAGIPHLDDL